MPTRETVSSASDATTIGESIDKDFEKYTSLKQLVEERVREIADEQFDEKIRSQFSLFRPKTWNRNSVAGAIAIPVTTLALFFIDRHEDVDIISKPAHFFLQTDAKIGQALSAFATQSKGENPLRDLISTTMRDSPVLAFHGQEFLQPKKSSKILNIDCLNEFNSINKNDDDVDPKYLHLPAPIVEESSAWNKCAEDLEFGEERSLDIPFHATLFGATDSTSVHQVHVALVIERYDETGNVSLPDEVSSPDEEKKHTAPDGLCITYHSFDVNVRLGQKISTGLDISNGFQSYGHGLWIADLSSILDSWIDDNDPPKDTLSPQIESRLHSIKIEVVEPKGSHNGNKTSSSTDEDNSASEIACKDIKAAPPQIIGISSIVLVNKKFIE